ncbi:MAG TPA: pyridoxal-phosphate dependent enzyme [Sandaracinaceae bacterium]
MRAAPAPAWQVEERHLVEAWAVVRAHARRTPLADLAPHVPGAHAKLETEQDTGSFKLRGALAALAALDARERARGVITASAGNHGLGLARAGALFGVPVTVLVLRSAPRVKREAIARHGARVELVDAAGYDELELAARAAAEGRGLTFVSPFDDPRVAAGNGGTIALELLEQLPDVRTVIAPVGGGGLAAGLLAGFALRGASVRVVGVQSEACPAMVESFARGRALTRYLGAPGLAEGLEGGVSESTFAIARAGLARMEAVPEARIADAMRFAAHELATPIEGSAAVALAWALAHADDPELERPIAVLFTGRNVDPEVLRAIGA